MYPGSSASRVLEMIGYPDFKTFTPYEDHWHYRVHDGIFTVEIHANQVMRTSWEARNPD